MSLKEHHDIIKSYYTISDNLSLFSRACVNYIYPNWTRNENYTDMKQHDLTTSTDKNYCDKSAEKDENKCSILL